ncbi:hypothetical protein GCM10011504_10700 [Siccirubricoccus deserti]|uniref:Uncharacterized protein n=1 Tax=Siccirubricoccus deserti TaxID=2013562 RepID=A0A9X0QXY7_9PROT|nr:hypothetical protein [Siccirubricoccus deserti]MBC4014687.1 hypothetical protein [Siccirubricoccus deserti]GGC34229.1 hypothetical protein GCM10011504_10700 [Siccirubricoccus deserti]
MLPPSLTEGRLTFLCRKFCLRPELTGWQRQLLDGTPPNLFISGQSWVMLFFILGGSVAVASLLVAATAWRLAEVPAIWLASQVSAGRRRRRAYAVT